MWNNLILVHYKHLMGDITEKPELHPALCIAAFGHKSAQEHGLQLSRSCHGIRKTWHIPEHSMNYSSISHENKILTRCLDFDPFLFSDRCVPTQVPFLLPNHPPIISSSAIQTSPWVSTHPEDRYTWSPTSQQPNLSPLEYSLSPSFQFSCVPSNRNALFLRKPSAACEPTERTS